MLRSARDSTNAPSSEAIIEIASARERLREQAAFDQALGGAVDPAVEHVRARLAHRLVRAGDLQRDGRDRAGVGVVAFAQRHGGGGEEVARRRHGVLAGLEEGVEQLAVDAARPADDLLAELLLAAREEVVERAERRARLGDDLLHAGAREALPAKQLGAVLDDPLLVSAAAIVEDDTLRATRAIYLFIVRIRSREMAEIELTAGTIEYRDTGGEGPVLVLLGGLVMDGSVWDPLVDDLRRDHRCVVPTLPLGAHRKAMHADADLSLHGFARMVGELLERLDLRT